MGFHRTLSTITLGIGLLLRVTPVYSIDSCSDLFATSNSNTLKNSIFQLSPDQFLKRVVEVESLMESHWENLFGADEFPVLTGPPLQRITHDLEILQKIFIAVMGQKKMALIPELVQINLKLNLLLDIASTDDRTDVKNGLILIHMDPVEKENDVRNEIKPLRNAEVLEHEMHVNKDGLLTDREGNQLNTPAGMITIFVMTADLKIYVKTVPEKSRDFKHSSFFGTQPLAGAGQMVIKNGRLDVLSDQSGHFLPPRLVTQQVVQRLQKLGVDRSSYKLVLKAPEETGAVDR